MKLILISTYAFAHAERTLIESEVVSFLDQLIFTTVQKDEKYFGHIAKFANGILSV